jgi:hypothetical protein
MKQDSSTSYQIDPALIPHIESFISEAAKRGHTIEKKNLIAQFSKASDGALCGSCNSLSSDPTIQKIISIYNINPCWFNDLQLETLVFHELGHCILGRVHLTDTLSNGNPKSIMVPDNLALYAPCIYPLGNQPCDMTFKRAYYLNELFDPNTGPPDWAP